MKKNINEIRNNRTFKKAAIGVSAAALALTMGISAFAAQDTANANKWDRTGIGVEAALGQKGQMNQEKPEDGKSPLDDIKEKIDALESSSTKTKLNKLVDALEEAMEAEHKLMEANRPELPEKTETESESTDSSTTEKKERPALPENMQNGQRPELPEGAENGQRPEGGKFEESDEMKEAREAVEAARKALDEALEEAGIEVSFGMPGHDGQKPEMGQKDSNGTSSDSSAEGSGKLGKPDRKPDRKPDKKPDSAPEIPEGESAAETETEAE